MKSFRNIIEALAVIIFFGVFKVMPAHWASHVGGFIGRHILYHLPSSAIARRNLNYAKPTLTKGERNAIIRDMWENIGRIFAEYPHLDYIAQNNVELVIAPETQALLDMGQNLIVTGGHIGNWELKHITFFKTISEKMCLTYRAPNNPYVAKILDRIRTLNGRIMAINKSASGGIKLVKALRKGHSAGILVDQKYNPGLMADFFGKPATINQIFAQLAIKYDLPITPMRCERLQGCQFRITLDAPIQVPDTIKDTDKVTQFYIEHMNKTLERWIDERPAQWLWIHRRWKNMQ